MVFTSCITVKTCYSLKSLQSYWCWVGCLVSQRTPLGCKLSEWLFSYFHRCGWETPPLVELLYHSERCPCDPGGIASNQKSEWLKIISLHSKRHVIYREKLSTGKDYRRELKIMLDLAKHLSMGDKHVWACCQSFPSPYLTFVKEQKIQPSSPL